MMKNKGKCGKVISAALALLLMVSVCSPVSAATARATTMKLESTTGTVTLKSQNGAARKITKGMRLYNGNTLETAASSYAYVSLDSSKAVKLDAKSKVSLRQSGRQLELLVKSGKLFFNVKTPLGSSESMNVRTSTMVTGVRGTCGIVEAVSNEVSTLHLLEGKVSFTTTDPKTGKQETTMVVGGQTATVKKVSEGAENIVVAPMSEEEIPLFAIEEVAKDSALQKKIESTTNLQVDKMIDYMQKQLQGKDSAGGTQNSDSEKKDTQDDSSGKPGSANGNTQNNGTSGSSSSQNGGTSGNGTSNSGASNSGTSGNGTSNSGTSNNGGANNGIINNGSSNGGSQSGSAPNGGPVNNGTANGSTGNNGSQGGSQEQPSQNPSGGNAGEHPSGGNPSEGNPSEGNPSEEQPSVQPVVLSGSAVTVSQLHEAFEKSDYVIIAKGSKLTIAAGESASWAEGKTLRIQGGAFVLGEGTLHAVKGNIDNSGEWKLNSIQMEGGSIKNDHVMLLDKNISGTYSYTGGYDGMLCSGQELTGADMEALLLAKGRKGTDSDRYIYADYLNQNVAAQINNTYETNKATAGYIWTFFKDAVVRAGNEVTLQRFYADLGTNMLQAEGHLILADYGELYGSGEVVIRVKGKLTCSNRISDAAGIIRNQSPIGYAVDLAGGSIWLGLEWRFSAHNGAYAIKGVTVTNNPLTVDASNIKMSLDGPSGYLTAEAEGDYVSVYYTSISE